MGAKNLELSAAAGALDRSSLRAALANDGGLCADLLALANAPCFSPPGAAAIETLDEALDVVGVNTLAALAGTSCAFESVRSGCANPRQWAEYQRHTRDVAAGCRSLAQILGQTAAQGDAVAIAGLTHDIGRVVIMAATGDVSASLLGTRPDDLLRVVPDERQTYGLDHCEIGHALFHRWGFSAAMQEGILRHHSPLVRDDFSLPGALIFVAHFVMMTDLTGDILARMLKPALLERLGMKLQAVEEARALCSGGLGLCGAARCGGGRC